MQHDIYTWQVDATKLKKVEKLTNESKIVNDIVREWLETTTSEQRKKFGDILYELIGKTEAKTIPDFSAQLFKNIRTIIDTYKTMDENDKKQLEEMIKLTLTLITTSLKNEVIGKKQKNIEISNENEQDAL